MQTFDNQKPSISYIQDEGAKMSKTSITTYLINHMQNFGSQKPFICYIQDEGAKMSKTSITTHLII